MSDQIMKQKYDVVIIGSGFSGIVSAGLLADHGLSILMVDENFHIGGQLLRKIPEALGQFPSYHPDHVKKIGFAFVESVKKQKITIMNRTCLIGFFEEKRLLFENERKKVLDISCEYLLFATGARERYLPFKGWTLPGVYSAGMAQVMMKSSGIMPAKNVLVGGSGLFLFSVGYELLRNRVKVPAILEQTGMMDKMKLLPQLFSQFSKFAEGGKFLSKIYLSGVPVKYRSKIIEARGSGCLEEVVVGKVDSNGTLKEGSEKIYKTGALALGYGFTANIEAPQAAGCELEYSESKGGWVVKVDENLQTTRKGVLAAGEITGIGGALKSITEGKIAATTILLWMGKIHREEYPSKMEKLSRERAKHLKFSHYFNTLYSIPGQFYNDIPEETTICRCEDITMKDITDGIACGYNNPMALKSGMRISMGNCQGRTCGPVVYDILNAVTNQSHEMLGVFNVRPPLKPVSIAALSNLQKQVPKP